MSDPLTTVYATDEDVAIKAAGDFCLLAPRFQLMASGVDGAIAAGSWDLTSASASFVTAEVALGDVVWLTKPITVFKGNGDIFGIDSAAATTLTLHRIGLGSGEGRTPVLTSTTAIEYSILTLFPQIEEASFQLNRAYNIDDSVPGRTPSDLWDLRDLKEACVLKVLILRLAGEIQSGLGNAWGVKLDYYRKELEAVESRLRLRWATDAGAPPATPQAYSTRIVR